MDRKFSLPPTRFGALQAHSSAAQSSPRSLTARNSLSGTAAMVQNSRVQLSKRRAPHTAPFAMALTAHGDPGRSGYLQATPDTLVVAALGISIAWYEYGDLPRSPPCMSCGWKSAAGAVARCNALRRAQDLTFLRYERYSAIVPRPRSLTRALAGHCTRQ